MRGLQQSFVTAPSPGIIASAMLNEHYLILDAYIASMHRVADL